MKVILQNVRLAFPHLFEAKAVNEGEDKAFSASFIFDKKHSANKTVNDAVEAVALDKWEKESDKVLKTLRASDKVCLRSGDTKPDYDGFPGNMFISARNKARPLVLDRDKSQLSAADGRPYGGCYVNATVDVWAQSNKYGKRINATLTGVQFLKDGDAFIGATPASVDDFEDLSLGSDASDLV